jgi:hypothetical protein
MTLIRISEDDELSRLMAQLPAGLDLEATAVRSRALVRRRGVRCGADLLRLALCYGACGLSLRATAAWAEAAGVARLSDVALRQRLRGAAAWLGEIVGAVLSERLAAGPAEGCRLRLVDATTLSRPGSRKADWRLHVRCRLGGGRPRIEQVELTDGRGSESLSRFARTPGDIDIIDRGYAKARDLAKARAQGGDFIARTGWNALRLRSPDGGAFDLFAFLERVPERGTAEAAVAVALDQAGRRLVPVRLVVGRLDAAATERNARRARRKSSKQGKTLRDETLRAAGFVLLVTSLDAERFPAADVLALYRLRWQIELVFKRLKSILDLDCLPAADPGLARAWINAKLIAALLLEDIAGQVLDSPPCARRNAASDRLALARPAPALRHHPLGRHSRQADAPGLDHRRPAHRQAHL